MPQSLANESGAVRTPVSRLIAAFIIGAVIIYFPCLLDALQQPALAGAVCKACGTGCGRQAAHGR